MSVLLRDRYWSRGWLDPCRIEWWEIQRIWERGWLLERDVRILILRLGVGARLRIGLLIRLLLINWWILTLHCLIWWLLVLLICILLIRLVLLIRSRVIEILLLVLLMIWLELLLRRRCLRWFVCKWIISRWLLWNVWVLTTTYLHLKNFIWQFFKKFHLLIFLRVILILSWIFTQVLDVPFPIFSRMNFWKSFDQYFVFFFWTHAIEW